MQSLVDASAALGSDRRHRRRFSMDRQVIGADDPKHRDLSMVKTCDCCGALYHPRKNGYQTTSRFCSQQCSRKCLRDNPQ